MYGLSVRTFRDGDEPAIVELFNNVYSGYGGFVPKTVEYWRWCCLERPDVEKEGIFLAFDGERLCGYLVAGSSGNIWEFCVADDDRDTAKTLLNEALGYLDKIGASSVSVHVPNGARMVEDLREAGFGEAFAARMFVTTLSPAALVQALVNPRKEVLMKKLDGEFGVQLRDVPYGASKEFSVKIHNASVEVEEGFPAKPSVIVELRFMDLLSVLFGGSSAGRLLLTGKMRVKPFRKSRTVLTLLSTIRLRSSWFFPLSDSN